MVFCTIDLLRTEKEIKIPEKRSNGLLQESDAK